MIMKRIIAFIMCLISIEGYAQISELKPDATNFLQEYYPDTKILSVSCKIGCDVILYDLTKIEFDKKGHWIEINARRSETGIPPTLIPKNIHQVISDKFPDAKVIEIENHYFQHELELTLDNGIEITYNASGDIIEINL